MAVAFLIPGYLRQYTGGASRVECESRPPDVRTALDELWKQHPGVRDRVLNERGEVRPHVNVFVGTESIRFTGGLETAVPADSEIWIVPAVSGG